MHSYSSACIKSNRTGLACLLSEHVRCQACYGEGVVDDVKLATERLETVLDTVTTPTSVCAALMLVLC